MQNILSSLGLLMGAPEASGGQAADPTGQMISTLVMFAALGLVFYFLILRPQNKKQKETKKMMDALKKGDKVQTIGGIRGSVWLLKDDSVVLKCDDNVKIEFVRSAIANVLEQKAAEEEKAPAEELEEKK